MQEPYDSFSCHLFLLPISYKIPVHGYYYCLNFQLRIREVKILFYIHFFLLQHSSFLYVVPSFSQRLNICCRAGLLGDDALGFRLSEKVFSSSSL